jgi:hypothetical protein
MYVRELQQPAAATMTRDLLELFMQQVTFDAGIDMFDCAAHPRLQPSSSGDRSSAEAAMVPSVRALSALCTTCPHMHSACFVHHNYGVVVDDDRDNSAFLQVTALCRVLKSSCSLQQGGQGAALSAALADVMCAWAAWVQSKAISNSAPDASSSSSLTCCCLCRGWIGGLVFQRWRWRSSRAVQPMRRCDVCRVTSVELAMMHVAGSSGACVDDAAAEAAAAADRCLRCACWCAHVTFDV